MGSNARGKQSWADLRHPSGAGFGMEIDVRWSILVVDDSAAARSQLRLAFEAKGAKVIEAETGQEGLWRARAELVDLILTDVHMPVMDGLRMIQELRKEPQHATTPIFVLSSDATVARAAEGKKAGATAWIVKPIQPDLLWKAVEKALFSKRPSSLERTATRSIRPMRGQNK
jgi:two-component system chemotaxis response regulator CheY